MGLSLSDGPSKMQQLMRYFDHNATTGLDPQVLEAMLPFLQTHWANPSSAYQFARPVKRALAEARAQVASLLQAQPEEILFTGCGTESINTALNLAAQLGPDRRHLVLSEVEHDANRRYAQYLERQGWEVTWLGVDAQGLLRAEQVREVLRPDTAMVSIMWANNETGVLFPMQAIAEVCQQQGVLLHTDAVQAAGKVEIDLRLVPADLLSLSAHKMHAPKGVGALFVRQGTPFDSYLLGGGQEGGRRAGTQNIPGIVAMGCAAQLAQSRLLQTGCIRELRDHLELGLRKQIEGMLINGHPTQRLPNTSNMAFEGIEGEALLLQLDRVGVAASSGSACSTGSLEPSHVLRAMGLSARQALSSIRLSLGHVTTREDIDYLLEHLPSLVARLRGQTPLKPESKSIASHGPLT